MNTEILYCEGHFIKVQTNGATYARANAMTAGDGTDTVIGWDVKTAPDRDYYRVASEALAVSLIAMVAITL